MKKILIGFVTAIGLMLVLAASKFAIENGILRSNLDGNSFSITNLNRLSVGGITNLGLTASRATQTRSDGAEESSATTSTELGYVSGVTSAIQAQINAKITGTRTVSTTTPLAGGGALSADLTLSIANAVADGSTKGAATFTAADFDSSSGLISIDYANGQAASGSIKGFLIAADWTAFNSKVGTSRTISTTSPLAGGGDLSGNLTLSIADAVADGSTKGAASFTASDFNATSGNIAIDYANGQASSDSVNGFMSSADHLKLTSTLAGITVDNGTNTISTGQKGGYITAPHAGTISGWAITAKGASPTCTFDVWKISTGTALPTVANTIMGVKPALATGNAIYSSTLTSWSTSVSAGDIIGFNLDSVSSASNIVFQIYYK